jgi:hypothetical protein
MDGASTLFRRMKRPENVGLCATCRHAETIVSARGSTFYLCRLALTDPHFSKYPTLPVLACEGYEPLAGRAREEES